MGRCPVTSGLCWLSKICRAPNWKRQYQKIPKKRFWLGIVFCAKRKVNDGILWLFYLLNCIHYWSLFPSVWTKTYLMSSVHHLTIPFRDSSCVNCGSKLGHGHHELVLAMAKNGLILSDPDCLMFSPYGGYVTQQWVLGTSCCGSRRFPHPKKIQKGGSEGKLPPSKLNSLKNLYWHLYFL